MAKSRKKKTTGWGGAREGAGRKPEFRSRVQLTFQVEQDEADAVAALADEAGMSLSGYLRRLVVRHLTTKGPKGVAGGPSGGSRRR